MMIINKLGVSTNSKIKLGVLLLWAAWASWSRGIPPLHQKKMSTLRHTQTYKLSLLYIISDIKSLMVDDEYVIRRRLAGLALNAMAHALGTSCLQVLGVIDLVLRTRFNLPAWDYKLCFVCFFFLHVRFPSATRKENKPEIYCTPACSI